MSRFLPCHACGLAFVLGAVAAALPAAAAPVEDMLHAPHPYFGARLGMVRPLADGDDDGLWTFGHGHGAGISGGARFGDFAAEVEMLLASLNASDRASLPQRDRVEGQEHLASLFLNGRWEPQLGALFYGIVGGGAGVTRVEWDRVRRDSAPLAAADETPSYALEAGLGSRFWGAVAFEVTWRRFGLGSFDYRETDGSPARMNDARHDLLCMGLRYDL